jgi:hypothetical protein
MQELSRLFGSAERVKLIRFFLSNFDKMYDIDEIEEATKIKKDILKTELSDLEKGLLVIKSKQRFAVEYEDTQKDTNFKSDKTANKNKIIKASKTTVREYTCYELDIKFRFLDSLYKLMFDFKNANRDVIVERFKPVGRCKLLILSGVFIDSDKSRLDILYVGEAVKDNIAKKIVEDINIEVGHKLNIQILDLEEFNYRYKMYDRFIRDILNENNEVLINKLNLSL